MKKFTWIVAILMVLAPLSAVAGDGLKFKSDLRLRYEYKDADGKSNRGRARFRLRIAAEHAIDENWTVGFRLASGSDQDPTSTNQSMDDAFEQKSVWIDRAYAIYKAGNFKLSAGKIANPFNTTDIMWDSDINLEGVAEQFKLGKNGYVTLGQMILAENSSASDAFLVGGQAGIKVNRLNLSVGYYTYNNYVENSPKAGGNLFENGTEFSLMDFLVKFKVNDNFSVWAHYVVNADAEVTATTGDKEDTAMGIGFEYKVDDWKFKAKYADIQPNSVIGAFADSDFGGANRQGYKISIDKKLRKNITFGASYFDTEQSSDSEKGFKILQLDLKYKF